MAQPVAAPQCAVVPFALKDTPALIEHLLPVQKLSAESYKEQMAGNGKTLTALGSYWKGRKPLILAKACLLGCLLPATANPKRDLEIFEMLMGMDDLSFAARAKRSPKPKEIIANLSLARIEDYFEVAPRGALLQSGPVDWSNPAYEHVHVAWRPDLPQRERRWLEAQMLPAAPYRERVNNSRRPEEVPTVHAHIWKQVNAPPGHGRPLLPGIGRATRLDALRPSPQGGRHLLRLGPNSLRGGAPRLRRLCLGPEPRCLHAHLGGLPHRGRLTRGARKTQARPESARRERSGRNRPPRH